MSERSAKPRSDGAEPAQSSEADANRRFFGSLTKLAGRWPKAVLVVWLVACAFFGASLRDDGLAVRGDLDGLIPQEHRAPPHEPLLMLELDAAAGDASSSQAQLLSAATAVDEALGDERVPIAAPRSDIEAWLDAHAMVLLPPGKHDQLRAQLTDDAMTTAIEGLRARLSSPLFGVSGEEARRDPLHLGKLMRSAGAGFGELGGPSAIAEVTSRGDLLAPEGTAILMQLRTERSDHDVLADVRAAIGDRDVTAGIVGSELRRDTARDLVASHWSTLAATTAAGLAIVLALALRKIRPALSILLCIGSALAAIVYFLPPLDVLSLPLLVLLAGFGCEGALHLQRISARGWPAAAVLGTALLPLWLSPYPQWRTWSLWWLLAVAGVIFVLRLVLPAMLSVMRGSVSWEGRGFLLRPMRLLAVVTTVGVLAGGAWAAEMSSYRGADRIDLGDTARPPRQVRLHESFFDPGLVAEARSTGRDAAAALQQAAIDARLLGALVPGEAVRIDSPGQVVLVPAELERRRQALVALELPQRMRELREALEARGFRPDAFGEFLRGASDLEQMPTPTAAVQGPLGPWIDRFVVETPEGAAIRSRVHVVPDPQADVPVVEDADGRRIELSGPVVAARRDRDSFRDWLGIYALSQIWIGAFVVWLGTRSLAIAISASFAALVTECAVLLLMIALNQPLGPHVVPALLLGGAAAMIAAGRSCRAMDLQRPFFAMGLLVTSLCQVVAGLALVASDVPLWVQIGLVAAAGSVIASGVGLFVAPGMARLLRRAGSSQPMGENHET